LVDIGREETSSKEERMREIEKKKRKKQHRVCVSGRTKNRDRMRKEERN